MKSIFKWLSFGLSLFCERPNLIGKTLYLRQTINYSLGEQRIIRENYNKYLLLHFFIIKTAFKGVAW